MASGASHGAHPAAAYHSRAERGPSSTAVCGHRLVTATRPPVLVATWGNGLFALAEQAFHAEWPGQSVRGLARDSSGDALAIGGGKSVCRRTAEGAWRTLAQSELELACCVGVGAAIYVGTLDVAQVLRVGDDESF